MELPLDIWRLIINNITEDTKDMKEIQFVAIAFIAQVSKQINSLCKQHKQQLGIQSLKVKSARFQCHFASNGYLNCVIYAHENGYEWSSMTCLNAAKNGHSCSSQVCPREWMSMEFNDLYKCSIEWSSLSTQVCP
jgi:hypothetical protein